MSVSPRVVGLTLLAPCWNEAENVRALVERVSAVRATRGVPSELLLVDDGSTDRTWVRLEELAGAHAWVRPIRHAENRGIVAAWRTGLAAASHELVCLIDADLQNRPEDVPLLLDAWQQGGADLVQGVRVADDVGARAVLSRGLNAVLNAAFRMRLRDNKSGFLLARRSTLEALLADAEGYRWFQSLVGAAAGVRGLTVVEVDTRFEPRHAGTSFLASVPIVASARVLGEVARYRVATWITPPATSRRVSCRADEAGGTRPAARPGDG